MIYLLIAWLVSLFLDQFTISRRSERHKDLQILLLRQQLRILQRQQPKRPSVSRWEKVALAVFTAKLGALGRGANVKLDEVLLLFKPATVLGWHRELVRRKWTFQQQPFIARHKSDPELVAVLLRLARENTSWGYSRLHGELLKLGYKIGRSTIRDILKRQHVPPAPERVKKGSNWREFLSHYADQMLACDFCTVETACLRTLYAFFVIELGSRRVHFGGCTAHPTAEWVTQQARHLTWSLQGAHKQIRFLIRARASKFTASFDRVWAAEGVEIIRTPYRAPKANAYAERWIRSARTECLERLLILNEAHVRRVMKAYIEHYNEARPHQGIEQRCSIPIEIIQSDGPAKRRDVLGGIIHEYDREAA
jgi:transposase InsO family protein